MTTLILLDRLTEFTRDTVKDLLLPARQQENDAETDEERGEHGIEEEAAGPQLFFLELDGEQLEPRLERGQTGIGEPPQGLAEARGRGVAHAALSGG